MGFPSEIIDDSLLDMALPASEPFEHAEVACGSASALLRRADPRFDNRGTPAVSGGSSRQTELKLLGNEPSAEFGEAHTYQADTQGHGVDRLSQRNADLVQLLARDDRRLQGPAAGHLPDVGVFDLNRYSSSKYLLLFAPSPNIVRHGSDTGLDLGRCRQVLGERGLRAR